MNSILQKVASAVLQSERIPFSIQVRSFHGNQVDICVHRFGDLLHIEAFLYIIQDLIIGQRNLRRKAVCLIFHSVIFHVEQIEIGK